MASARRWLKGQPRPVREGAEETIETISGDPDAYFLDGEGDPYLAIGGSRGGGGGWRRPEEDRHAGAGTVDKPDGFPVGEGLFDTFAEVLLIMIESR